MGDEPTRMGVTWLEPTSVEPRFFVDRTELREQFIGLLEERLTARGTYTICVTGMRGVGKSIFSRSCLESFAQRQRGRLVAVHVDLRMVGMTEFLREFIQRLAVNTRAALKASPKPGPHDQDLRRWLDEMLLLTQTETVSETQIAQVTAQYGSSASLKSALVGVLEVGGTFSWQESRQSGEGSARSFRVTADVMHRALVEVLDHIAKWTPLTVVVLFDDLDQIRTDDLKAAVRNVLDISHCVRVVHLRTEVLLDDIKREMDLSLEVPPLECDALQEMIAARVAQASASDQTLFAKTEIKEAIGRLCRATGNPLVLLRWLTAFAMNGAFLADRFALWNNPETLERVVRQSIVGAPRASLLKQIALAQDAAPEVEPGIIDAAAFERLLPEAARKEALRFALIGLVDPENPTTGYWADDRLALLRPKVAGRLAGKG